MSTETNKLNGDTEKRFSAEKSIFTIYIRNPFFFIFYKTLHAKFEYLQNGFLFYGVFHTNI